MAVAACCARLLAANTQVNVPNGTTDLTTVGNVNSASDLTFAAITYASTAFTIAGNAAVTAGTLNDLDATQSLTVGNGAASTTSSLTLSGGVNSVGPNAADLLYVASGGTLTIGNGSAGALNLTLGSAGNLNVAGTATINANLAPGANAVTKLGAGTLTLGGTNGGTGGFAIANGVVSVSSNSALGTAGGVTLGTAATNATLALTNSNVSGFAQAIAVGGVAPGALFNFSGGGSFSPTIAGLANATSTALGGSSGGVVFSGQNATQTLQLGGTARTPSPARSSTAAR